ncbi:Hypp1075 [Branchiostoma lanceolatum]|uniref:Hypp1075 protein n=1 Tax=Branchiostoma lanceolatum TaxID=7740 RepID=A0A8J9ZG66_BRALA|nr:Hypp1075 [Branchiostoma lanceolatum]
MKIERSTDYQYPGALEVHDDKEAAFSAVYSPNRNDGPGTADVTNPQRTGHHGPGSMGTRGSPRAGAGSPHTVGTHAASTQRTRGVPPHTISQALQHVAAAIPESFAKNDSCSSIPPHVNGEASSSIPQSSPVASGQLDGSNPPL